MHRSCLRLKDQNNKNTVLKHKSFLHILNKMKYLLKGIIKKKPSKPSKWKNIFNKKGFINLVRFKRYLKNSLNSQKHLCYNMIFLCYEVSPLV